MATDIFLLPDTQPIAVETSWRAQDACQRRSCTADTRVPVSVVATRERILDLKRAGSVRQVKRRPQTVAIGFCLRTTGCGTRGQAVALCTCRDLDQKN